MKPTFTLYCSKDLQNKTNTIFANKKIIGSCQDLAEAMAFDHVCALYRDNKRAVNNFLEANCAMFDIDNTESDNPQDWITIDNVKEAFPNVPFYISYSRNHMKWKEGKAPRPKFHVYFPHQVITDAEEYNKLKRKVCVYFNAFDPNAIDVARFFFGVEQPKVELIEGTLSLVDFMSSVNSPEPNERISSAHTPTPPVNPITKEKIPEGKRNTTLSRYGAKVLRRWGNSEKAYQLFLEKSKLCVPPLLERELSSIWKSAVKFFHETVEQDPDYIRPEFYHSERGGSQYCLEVKDFLAWSKLNDLLHTSKRFRVDTVQLLLKMFCVEVRINDMSKNIEVKGLPDMYQNEDAFDNLVTIVFDTALTQGFSYVHKSSVCDFLSLLANGKRYHPVMKLLNSTEWDKEDRFPELYRMMGISDSFDKTLVHKWALQTIAVLYNTKESPVGTQGVLVLQGNQGIGKTEFLRHLVIDDSFFKGGATLDMSNKDSMMSATKVWICELGEIDATTKKEQSALKAFLTETTDRYREPYARTESVRTRRTSFCGTVNPKEYLTDPTGNRRFWTIHMEEMDLDAIFSHPKTWYIQFWKQVQEEYIENPKGYLLNPQEQDKIIRRNSEYEVSLYGEDEFLTMFDVEADESLWEKRTAAQIVDQLNSTFERLNLASSSLGRNLLPCIEKRIGKKFQRSRSNGKQLILCPPVRPSFKEKESNSYLDSCFKIPNSVGDFNLEDDEVDF